jgi:hypothetical protein
VITIDPLAECEEHGGLASTCPVCQRAVRPCARWSRSFAATFDVSECDGCPHEIRTGQLIRLRGDGADLERRHAECC